MKGLNNMGSIFSSPKPSTQYIAPAVTTAPAVEEVVDEEEEAKKGRAALLATKGGLAGEELQSGQKTSRGTLLGN